MPTTKPMGPHQIAAYAESTPFTAEAISLSSGWLRALTTEIGDAYRERIDIQVTGASRGMFHEVKGRIMDASFKIELTYQGTGVDATDFAGKKALMEAAGFTVTESGTVSYALAANPTGTATIYRVDRIGLLGEYLHGAIVQKVTWELTKSGDLKIIITGIAARKVEFVKTTLGAALESVDGTSMTITDAWAIRDGDDDTTISNLAVYAQIESEIVKITDCNRSTGVCTIARGQLGTSGATHVISSSVYPVYSGITYEDTAADLIPGPHSWSASISTLGDDALRSITIDIETGRSFDELSTGYERSAAQHNKAVKVTGNMTYILNTTKQHLSYLGDAHTSLDIDITITSPGGDVWTLSMGNVYVLDAIPKNPAPHEIVEATAQFKALSTDIDSLDAFSATINVP